MSRTAIPTWTFVLVLVRLGARILVVRERKHGQLWYLPAGRVELGESLEAAAIRETLEEAGVPVILEGIVRVEHSVMRATSEARLRVIFTARPADDTPPKQVADSHSLEAGWYTLEELARMPLRSNEVLDIARHVLSGGTVAPRALLANEEPAV